METQIRLQTNEMFERKPEQVIAPDWTESEWFEVWLKLARREYEPVENPAAEPVISDQEI
jgi:hypothetical protein